MRIDSFMIFIYNIRKTEFVMKELKHGDESLLKSVRSHFDRQLAGGLSAHPHSAPRMWMASLDTRTGGYPENDERPANIPPLS